MKVPDSRFVRLSKRGKYHGYTYYRASDFRSTAEGKISNFTYDGQKIQGYEGEPIAAALKAAGILIHRYTKKEHTPRGIFCAIGRCTDCVMVVDGVPNVRTCVTPLKAGMKVQTQYGVSAEPFEEQKTGGQTR